MLRSECKNAECSECKNLLHLKCSRLDKQDYVKHTNGHLKFTCQFLTDYTCCRTKHVYYGQKAILCNVYQTWINIKFTGLTLDQYKNLPHSDES